ncbi:MAG TPA: aldehyde dehydrogenase [Acidimicrobiales bacterium]|jgi:betaine-aldehyde dehydrogenase
MDVRQHLYIGGEWVDPATDTTIDVVSPHSEEVIARVPHASTADIDRAVAAARRAFDDGPWPHMSPAERGDVMAAISAGITARSDEISTAISAANGCPISWSAMGQTLASTMVLDFYADLARSYAFEDERQGMMGPTLVRREPVGVVGAITPWNVPLFTTMLKFGPAMAAGCTLVAKPAPETPIDALILAEIAHDAGLPPGVLNIVPAGREVGEHLVTHPDVDKIGFTGSTAAGKRIGSLCADRLARFTLELGGKSAAILLDDVDLAAALPELVSASIMNNGQACVAQTRVLAPRDRYQEVAEGLAELFASQVVGDPLDSATTIGPLVTERQQARVLGYIDKGQAEGAKVAVGGGRPAGLDSGWYVEPTVFVDVDNDMTIAREEIFGPVVAVIPYEGDDEAVRLANASDYGLSGSVWGPDAGRALSIAKRVRTGTVSINGFILDFGSPFGGYKQSGMGRELGPEGLEAYLESKSINLIGETAVPATG